MNKDFTLIWKQSTIGKSINKLFYRGNKMYCPLCQSSYRKFLKFGVNTRENVWCPGCGALERHRLMWKYFQAQTDLLNGEPKSMLHVAPENIFSEKLSDRSSINYLTADLHDPNVMVKMDIIDIEFPANKFDVIYCSHVLEHVPDDAKAISEFYRVLKPGGWAILQVPINADKTFEDPSITDPEQREKFFGQYNHVRKYGPDFKNRLGNGGFEVDVVAPDDFLTDAEINQMGIMQDENIHYCVKN